MAPEDRPRPPVIPPKVKPPKKPRRPTGHKPLPDHLEVDEPRVTPPCCGHCNSEDLVVLDQVVEEKLTTLQAHQRRRRAHRVTCLCKRCLKRTTAEALAAPFPRSKVTCEWLAWMVTQKFFLLIPLDRHRHVHPKVVFAWGAARSVLIDLKLYEVGA